VVLSELILGHAKWGLESGAEGEWPNRERAALELQVGLLLGWKPENVLLWLFNNPDGSDDPNDQEQDLLVWLKWANNPHQAAGHVLNAIWSRQQADCPALR
jgi:hypothetical protein